MCTMACLLRSCIHSAPASAFKKIRLTVHAHTLRPTPVNMIHHIPQHTRSGPRPNSRLTSALLSWALWLGFADALPAVPNIIRRDATRQTINGFGICEAFHQARHIMEYPEPARTEILDLLFLFLLQPGACDDIRESPH